MADPNTPDSPRAQRGRPGAWPADFGARMDTRTAWVMARLIRHPQERGYAIAHLDDDRHRPD
ncbi:hypothetical protein [Streptomyces coffeae]|uniref:MarR family transcriptional regulator n=1 Tax=Streptomyces coffeae TaxID=621382 RepID=A0ABS1NQU0_9ACTN|nr:hypothetical protein [Streptomyces coffeae]MBL1102458.1 hypothetical protein [Streptomyces coffeae]